MSRRRRGALLLLLAVAGYAGFLAGRRLPQWQQADAGATVGAFHIHSNDSHDSVVPAEALAAAAHAGGLDFLVLTDHNEQRPHAAELQGVCVLSQAELSTGSGHAVQLGASYVPDATVRATPQVADAVVAAGGTLVLAHPSDAKRPWTGALTGVGGIEVANLAASARREGGRFLAGLLPALATWPLNRPLALAQLYRRDDAAHALWDSQPMAPWAGLCGSDTHGWIDLGLNIASWHVVLTEPWPEHGRAGAIAARLRAGRFHCTAGLLGRAPRFRFRGRAAAAPAAARSESSSAADALPGDVVAAAGIAAIEVEAPATDAGPSTLVLRRNGVVVQTVRGERLEHRQPVPGSYRAEVYVPLPRLYPGARWVPAIISNRIRLQPPSP